MLMRSGFAFGFLAVLVSATPAAALTEAEKMETCKFGADHQKLAGDARKKFLAKCMANVAPAAPAAAPKTQ
jgi:psiF repeat